MRKNPEGEDFQSLKPLKRHMEYSDKKPYFYSIIYKDLEDADYSLKRCLPCSNGHIFPVPEY